MFSSFYFCCQFLLVFFTLHASSTAQVSSRRLRGPISSAIAPMCSPFTPKSPHLNVNLALLNCLHTRSSSNPISPLSSVRSSLSSRLDHRLGYRRHFVEFTCTSLVPLLLATLLSKFCVSVFAHPLRFQIF